MPEKGVDLNNTLQELYYPEFSTQIGKLLTELNLQKIIHEEINILKIVEQAEIKLTSERYDNWTIFDGIQQFGIIRCKDNQFTYLKILANFVHHSPAKKIRRVIESYVVLENRPWTLIGELYGIHHLHVYALPHLPDGTEL